MTCKKIYRGCSAPPPDQLKAIKRSAIEALAGIDSDQGNYRKACEQHAFHLLLRALNIPVPDNTTPLIEEIAFLRDATMRNLSSTHENRHHIKKPMEQIWERLMEDFKEHGRISGWIPILDDIQAHPAEDMLAINPARETQEFSDHLSVEIKRIRLFVGQKLEQAYEPLDKETTHTLEDTRTLDGFRARKTLPKSLADFVQRTEELMQRR